MNSCFNHADLTSWQPELPSAGPEPEIGETRSFVPTCFSFAQGGSTLQSYGIRDEALRVTGVCVSVNREHRMARYRYETPRGGKAYECFKF